MSVDPIEYPSVRLGEETYTLKFNCAAIIRLKQQYGVDLFAMERTKGADTVDLLCKMLAAGLHHTRPELTPDHLASTLEYHELMAFDAPIAEAVKKVFAQAKSLPAAS